MIAARRLAYWDMEADGLREHRLWRTRFVPWHDGSYVGLWQNDSRGQLNIEYTRPEPHSITGRTALPSRIIVDPRKRQQFLDQLRRFTPQAEFET
jgi:hypothetical protein